MGLFDCFRDPDADMTEGEFSLPVDGKWQRVRRQDRPTLGDSLDATFSGDEGASMRHTMFRNRQKNRYGYKNDED